VTGALRTPLNGDEIGIVSGRRLLFTIAAGAAASAVIGAATYYAIHFLAPAADSVLTTQLIVAEVYSTLIVAFLIAFAPMKNAPLALRFTSAGDLGLANETAATTLFALLFLLFLGLGFRNIRQHRIARHREWMIRDFGVALGIATTRPIVGAFFAARRLKPQEFFGAAFWLGFMLTLLAAEASVRYTARDEQTKLSQQQTEGVRP
jgi:hypothetical protein